MSFLGRAAYDSALNGRQRYMASKASVTTVSARSYSTWLSGGFPAAGAIPTTGAAPTRATAGALGQENPLGTGYLLRTILSWTARGTFTFADRLSHQGGLSGTATGAQTTNLPTTALTRYTTGVGVQIGLEIYTAIGATGTTVTASYTDQGGTSGNVAPLTTWGGTGFNGVSRIVILPYAVGDSGARAVASVTATATTGTLGAFGVTLFQPLLTLPVSLDVDVEALFGQGCWFPEILTDACLFGIVHTNGTATGVMQMDLKFGEA